MIFNSEDSKKYGGFLCQYIFEKNV